ncbi:hypothetical protein DLJ49_03675 [Rhodovulum sp. 12E13]|uniref:hypothetical protein n=1 Tax=Rhodovulum sp. 12E13 TaxID=2203891 RepID=UPI000E171312|nr:hypothetical protein [Rhodovulum sp. 12E13]RDC74402.1 hypothetical protein DLJ49_03675 [Rhodovulum sp. 12E13]
MVIYMKSLVISAAAALTLVAGAAQAVTVKATEQSDNMTISAGGFVDGGLEDQGINGTSISFTWSGASSGGAYGAIEFSLPGAAELTFDAYTPTSGTSAFVLFKGELTPGFQPGDTELVVTSVANGTAPGFTGGIAGATSTFVDNGSNLNPNPGSPVFSAIDGSEPLFVPGGNWVLGFYESSEPTNGTAMFTISAVPLPASAWFLVAGVGAVAWRARRRAA